MAGFDTNTTYNDFVTPLDLGFASYPDFELPNNALTNQGIGSFIKKYESLDSKSQYQLICGLPPSDRKIFLSLIREYSPVSVLDFNTHICSEAKTVYDSLWKEDYQQHLKERESDLKEFLELLKKDRLLEVMSVYADYDESNTFMFVRKNGDELSLKKRDYIIEQLQLALEMCEMLKKDDWENFNPDRQILYNVDKIWNGVSGLYQYYTKNNKAVQKIDSAVSRLKMLKVQLQFTPTEISDSIRNPNLRQDINQFAQSVREKRVELVGQQIEGLLNLRTDLVSANDLPPQQVVNLEKNKKGDIQAKSNKAKITEQLAITNYVLSINESVMVLQYIWDIPELVKNPSIVSQDEQELLKSLMLGYIGEEEKWALDRTVVDAEDDYSVIEGQLRGEIEVKETALFGNRLKQRLGEKYSFVRQCVREDELEMALSSLWSLRNEVSNKTSEEKFAHYIGSDWLSYSINTAAYSFAIGAGVLAGVETKNPKIGVDVTSAIISYWLTFQGITQGTIGFLEDNDEMMMNGLILTAAGVTNAASLGMSSLLQKPAMQAAINAAAARGSYTFKDALLTSLPSMQSGLDVANLAIAGGFTYYMGEGVYNAAKDIALDGANNVNLYDLVANGTFLLMGISGFVLGKMYMPDDLAHLAGNLEKVEAMAKGYTDSAKRLKVDGKARESVGAAEKAVAVWKEYEDVCLKLQRWEELLAAKRARQRLLSDYLDRPQEAKLVGREIVRDVKLKEFLKQKAEFYDKQVDRLWRMESPVSAEPQKIGEVERSEPLKGERARKLARSAEKAWDEYAAECRKEGDYQREYDGLKKRQHLLKDALGDTNEAMSLSADIGRAYSNYAVTLEKEGDLLSASASNIHAEGRTIFEAGDFIEAGNKFGEAYDLATRAQNKYNEAATKFAESRGQYQEGKLQEDAAVADAAKLKNMDGAKKAGELVSLAIGGRTEAAFRQAKIHHEAAQVCKVHAQELVREAEALAKLGKYDEALAKYGEAIDGLDAAVEGYRNAGRFYKEAGERATVQKPEPSKAVPQAADSPSGALKPATPQVVNLREVVSEQVKKLVYQIAKIKEEMVKLKNLKAQQALLGEVKAEMGEGASGSLPLDVVEGSRTGVEEIDLSALVEGKCVPPEDNLPTNPDMKAVPSGTDGGGRGSATTGDIEAEALATTGVMSVKEIQARQNEILRNGSDGENSNGGGKK